MNRPHGKIAPQKAQDFKGTMRQLLAYLKNAWHLIIISATSAFVASFFGVLAPIFSGTALTLAYNKWAGLAQTMSIFGGLLTVNLNQSLILLLISAAISGTLNYTQGFLLIGITQKLTLTMRTDLADKINTLPLSYFDKYKFGDVLSRVTNDVDTISQTLTQSLSEIFRAFALVTCVMGAMFILKWDLALIAAFGVILSLYVVSKFVKLSQIFFKQAAKNNGDMNGHVEEIFNGHNVVKVFNYQDKAKKEFDEINDRIFETSWRSQFVSGIMVPVQFFFTNLSYIAIALYGGYLVVEGALAVGFIATFIVYTRQVAQPIQSIGNSASVLQQTAASAERIFQLLNASSEEDESMKEKQLTDVKGHVRFEDVNFSYVPGTEIIKGFSADVKPGQMVAIVGPTGAGKTTIVNLLMRFYEIQSGKITIDGVDIKDMSRDELRSYFGMVLQDTWIFDGSIKDNIMYGSNHKTNEEMKEAAINAQTDHFIKSLPGGYNFMLNEDGLNISQGQRQLITISRVMLADKPMLILDEATSSVDTRTEILIQTAMDRLMKGRTSFVIAHRLSTIKNADVIFVMKDGNIIEQGNHEELLKQNGFYAELYNSQFNN